MIEFWKQTKRNKEKKSEKGYINKYKKIANRNKTIQKQANKIN